ncbi:MAG TPA: DUF3794 domain-containing protein [Bacillota bacterium]|nr:DUF3794 domain-containing protein [Bacillota bacterium]
MLDGVFIVGVLATLALIIACTIWLFRLHHREDTWLQSDDSGTPPPPIKEQNHEDLSRMPFAQAASFATATREEVEEIDFNDHDKASEEKAASEVSITEEAKNESDLISSTTTDFMEDSPINTAEDMTIGLQQQFTNELIASSRLLKGSEVSEVEAEPDIEDGLFTTEGISTASSSMSCMEVTDQTAGQSSMAMRGGKIGMDPLVRAEVVIGEATRQILVETNVTLTQPAIKVRNITAEIRELTTDLILDKVIIQGILHKQIFFVGNDNIVHHQAEDVPFSTFVEVPGAEPGQNVQINTVIETVIFTLLNPTTLHQKAVIEFFIKVTESRQLNIVEGTGPLVRLDKVVGDSTKQELIENIITLERAAIKIDDITAEVRNLTVEVIEDKVIVQGVVHKQIFFVGTDNIEFHQGEDVDFSTFVDIPGAQPGMDVIVEPNIEFIHFELLDATTLLQKVVVEFFIKVTESVQINVALGPGALLKLDTVVGERTCQILVESILTLSQAAIKVREIMARVENITTEVIEDKVIIQGILHKQIFFINEDNVEIHQAENVPFSTFVDLPGAIKGMDVRIEPIIETILFELVNSTTLRQKVVIEFFVKVTEAQQLQVALVSPYGPYYF